ncbi:putative transcriptional regulator (endogenous virus) [Clostridium phage phiCT453B]|uniref:hypothetical protein n=1 Tax=Clostridium tetani TaxID=1513 RepID=UPI0005130079|nr:hypothetical protein [Clostridium tetani]YP_009217921.1 putative transcriptional regulator [Clostridium phage phiCT453B]AJA42577.1 putative transcriptional regulator [Clostridium phage phiCT453B]KGI45298.1 hypothetical protein KY55_01300 [Clostridium tetani]
MINKETFRKTEGRIYRYYKQLKEIDKFEYICRQLEEQKEKIRNDIKETNIFIEEESRSITYEERVQTSSTGSSYAENECIRQIEKLEKEWKYVRRKLLRKKARIRELERQVTPLKYNINMLSEESKRFIEWKYAEGKSVDWIANKMYGGARSTAYRKREELVENIAQWYNIIE